MNDDRMQELFREMRDEPVPPDSLARVRMKVAERTARAPHRVMWWRWAAGLAAVVAALLFVFWPKPAPRPVEVAKKAIELPPPVIETRVIADPPVVRPVRAKRAAPAAKPAPRGAVAIRIETPDPDVVILLLGDEGPGE
jgi:hypothetical protein